MQATESPRALAADRLAHDVTRWLFSEGVLSPGISAWAEAWEMTEAAAIEMMDRIKDFEEGRISFAELEASGVRYVEAWQEADREYASRKAA